MKTKKRKVKIGVFKDYLRGAKHFKYEYITINNRDYCLGTMGRLDDDLLPVKIDEDGNRYTILDNVKYILEGK